MDKGVIRLIPGPVSVAKPVSKAFAFNYPSPDLDEDFFLFYEETAAKLNKVLGASGSVILQTGEGMLGLWGALKNCLKPGEKLYAICNGVFGHGIGDMAESIGIDVKRYSHPYDCINFDYQRIEEDIKQFKPKMIAMVHCETPSGVVNPLDKIAELKVKYSVPLFCIDSVASAGGLPVDVDKYHVDLSLNGSQKCFSTPPDLTMVTVSKAAWEVIESVNYQGYDAFLPFKDALANKYFPNTLSWHSIAALAASIDMMFEEGLESVYRRHVEARDYCLHRLRKMDIQIYVSDEKAQASTVTAAYLPENIEFSQLYKACLEEGVAIAGSYGKLAQSLFRIGHMGNQANLRLLTLGLDRLEEALLKLRRK